MSKKEWLIEIISASSNKYGDLLLEFMDEYNLLCLKDATEAQLREFIERRLGGSERRI